MTGVVEAPVPPGPPSAAPPGPAPSRRRAWLVTAAVALLVLLYLTGWSAYAAVHTGERYHQLAPGAPGSRMGAQFRLLSLVRTDRLTDREGGSPQVADAGAVFVVAELEMVQQQEVEYRSCSDTDLLGPGGRLWEPISTEALRRVTYCDSADTVIGQPYRFENVYLVPDRYAGAVLGVALTDALTPKRTLVLRPPA